MDVDVGALYQGQRARVERLARSMLGGRAADAEVDDAVHDVFAHVVVSAQRFRGDSHITSWLHGLAMNVLRARRRMSGRRPEGYRAREVDADDVITADTPERHAEIAELAGIAERLLAGEPKKLEALRLQICGLEAAEIAALIGVGVGTVRTRQWYAVRSLRALWPEEG